MLITDICSIFATASRAIWDGLFKEVRKTCIFPLFIIQCLTHTEKAL